ncbi:hypothetical protein KCU77_g11366, partial [Aureobasidium melanogenum]
MSNPYQLPPPVTAEPKHRFFDPWKSSSTGHQKADNRLAGSTSWRDSRSLEFSNQFGGGASVDARLADTVGAGSEDFGKDGRLDNGSWAKGAPGLRSGSHMSVVEAFRIRKVGVKDTPTEKARAKIMVNRGKEQELDLLDIPSAQPVPQHSSQDQDPASSFEDELLREDSSPDGRGPPRSGDRKRHHTETSSGVCWGLHLYQWQHVSDNLGPQVQTPALLGSPNASSIPGAGGGLSASKMQKEITKIGGKNVKFVTVERVMESVTNGKRAPEQKFEAVRLALKGTGRVEQMFAKAAKKA